MSKVEQRSRSRAVAATLPAAEPPGARLIVLAAGALAVLVAVGLLAASGLLDAGGPFDPGPAVRYGLPVARAVHDLAATVTIGLLVVAAWMLAPDRSRSEVDLAGVRGAAVRLASTAASIWLASALLVVVLTTADVSGIGLGTPGFGGVLVSFLSSIDLGRALGVSALVVAVVAALTFSATRLVTVAWAAALAVFALLPLSLTGHSASAGDHMNSVDSLAFHLVASCLWVGGLAALVLLGGKLGDQRATVAARYSRLAGWCFVVVAASGVINTLLRLTVPADLDTAYGRLVMAKTVALVLLGLAGWAHRTSTLRALAERPRLFWRLAAAELLLMGATVGLAVALSRSAPPVPDVALDPVTALLGFPAPPPVSVERYLAAFYPDLLWLSIAVTGAALYLAGVIRLRRRGDTWPWHRTVAWLAGSLALIVITSGGPAVYGRLHFSLHMIQHMSLMIVVPLLWVFGAPITLALRAINARTDGSFGPRETLLRLVHSRPLRLLGQPVVSTALFIGGLVIFYYTGLFELAVFTHTGHVLMTAHFLGTGYLFVWSLVGVDPGPERPGYPFRLLILLMSLGFHAFFGISLMSSETLLAPDWWHALGQTDDAALLADQQTGGSIAWAAGDIPSLLLGLALIAAWVRDDTRRARQLDRRADRDGDAELRRHNERLAELARRDGRA